MVQTGVLVAALLALGAGGALNPASALQFCGAPDKEVGYSEDEVMFSNTEKSNLWAEGYVQPGRYFAGISVKVNQGNVQHVAWFPAAPCFPDTGEKWDWVKVKVTKDLQGTPPTPNNHCYIRFDLVSTYCKKNCNRHGNVSCRSLGGLSVVARGPSNWKSDHPEINCLVKMESRPPPPPVYICRNPPFRPPPNTTETTSTTTATDLSPSSASSASSSPSVVLLIVVPVVAVVIFLVIVVVVVVVVCRRRRRRRSAASLPCVPTRRGLAASWRVGSEVQVDDNHVDVAPPTGPTVLPRVAPRQQEPDYLYFGDDEEHIYDEFPEPPIYEEIPEPPTYENVAEHSQCHVDEDSDSDDGNYLTPRRAPPGTPSGVTKG
ncbi:uncharacterized protein LOC127001250 [Eriocheir sinensis]|uniref:uncharacterized protein LOC127001250 n=1 Tax=Eriocheir sinensis TaxID=95602 RepID=UPI0021C81CFF|nr:uncharacterized protein LOC127001250 [Eriocheir sinensis]